MRAWSEFLSPSTPKPVDFLPSLRDWPAWTPWNKQIDYVKSVKYGGFKKLYEQFEERMNSGDKSGYGSFMDIVRNRREEFGFKDKEDFM
jgi:hypothetical protein